jgi:hypothetical protein
VVGDHAPTAGEDVKQVTSSPSAERAGTRSPAPGRAPPSATSTWNTERTEPIEIVAPDRFCATLLLEYAAPLFAAEIVAGPAWIVRLQPPAGGAWVLELLVIVERWLESAPLPCATVHYGGRDYLIRASTQVAQFAAVESASAGNGSS